MYTVVSLNVDLAGEPNTIDFTLASFEQICYCFIHLCELPWSVLTLTCARITHFDRDREGINRDLCVLSLRCAARRRCHPFFVYPLFFCLAELQFREPFPARLHVFLSGFLRRGWLQPKIGIGVTGTRRYFTLEPAQTWAFQEENPRRVCAGPRGESCAQDRRWAAASRLSRFHVHQQKRTYVKLPTVNLFGCPSFHIIILWLSLRGTLSAVVYRFEEADVMAFWCALILDMMPKM